MAEFCCAELGAVLGVSSVAAKRLIGNALELATASPACGAPSTSGKVPAWRARLVAEATAHATPALTIEAAGWIDAQVAAVAGKVGTAQLDRLVTEAITRFHLDTTDANPKHEDDNYGTDDRHVTVEKDLVSPRGTMGVTAVLDLADALDLDHTLSHHAATLKALGSTEPLNARRATALGHLARTQTSLDLAGQDPRWLRRAPAPSRNPDPRWLRRRRQPVSKPPPRSSPRPASSSSTSTSTQPQSATGGISFDHLGRMEEGQRLLLLDQIRSWCADSHTRVVLKPVIDLNQPLRANGYAIPDRIRDHVILRDRTCVFPHCTRPARRCQVDHIEPLRPRRPRRRQTPTRSYRDREPRGVVHLPPPTQDPHRLALHHGRTRDLRVDEPPQAPLPRATTRAPSPLASPGFETGPFETAADGLLRTALRPSSTTDGARRPDPH